MQLCLLPLQGALLKISITQGDALGYVLVAPSGRMVHILRKLFLHISLWAYNNRRIKQKNSVAL